MSFRKTINNWLKPYGYEITKIDKFKQLLTETYKKSENFKFMQIGANDGVRFDNLYDFVTQRRCSGIVVEPLKFYFEKLKHNYRQYPDIIPVNLAIHSTETKAVIHHVDPEKLDLVSSNKQGIGSLDPDHHKKSQTPSEYMIAEEVECVHVMDLIHQYNLLPLDLLQIDVEGYDAQIIKMIDFTKVTPRLIKYEHESLSDEDQKQTISLLESQGYQVFSQRNDTVAFLLAS